jgi:hypothetical protein
MTYLSPPMESGHSPLILMTCLTPCSSFHTQYLNMDHPSCDEGLRPRPINTGASKVAVLVAESLDSVKRVAVSMTAATKGVSGYRLTSTLPARTPRGGHAQNFSLYAEFKSNNQTTCGTGQRGMSHDINSMVQIVTAAASLKIPRKIKRITKAAIFKCHDTRVGGYRCRAKPPVHRTVMRLSKHYRFAHFLLGPNRWQSVSLSALFCWFLDVPLEISSGF